MPLGGNAHKIVLLSLGVAQEEILADASVPVDPGAFHLLHRKHRFMLDDPAGDLLFFQQSVNLFFVIFRHMAALPCDFSAL